MRMLSAIRSKMSGQTTEEFGSGQRFPLTKDLKRAISLHMNDLDRKDLSRFTFERRSSYYPDAKSDIVIYDDEEQPVLHGRESNDGLVSIWR
jgi:hypothetical protein